MKDRGLGQSEQPRNSRSPGPLRLDPDRPERGRGVHLEVERAVHEPTHDRRGVAQPEGLRPVLDQRVRGTLQLGIDPQQEAAGGKRDLPVGESDPERGLGELNARPETFLSSRPSAPRSTLRRHDESVCSRSRRPR